MECIPSLGAYNETKNNTTEKQKEIDMVQDQLTAMESEETTDASSTTIDSNSKAEVNCTKALNLNFAKATVNEIFNQTESNLSFNSNNPENVTIVLVRGDTVEKALDFGTNSLQTIEIKCCGPEGKIMLKH